MEFEERHSTTTARTSTRATYQIAVYQCVRSLIVSRLFTFITCVVQFVLFVMDASKLLYPAGNEQLLL